MPMPDFSQRQFTPERMDDPDCDRDMLLRTVRQFKAINRLVSRYRGLLRRTVLGDMRRDPARAYHLVDLGAGGCDIAAWLLKQARAGGLTLRITAVDADARTVAWATARYAGMDGLRIVCADATTLGAYGAVDYVFANHVLHHLDDARVRDVLQRVDATAQRGYVLSDIRRGRLAYWGVTLLTGLCFRRSFAYEDGRLSVRRSFTAPELRAQLPAASAARVVRVFPARLAVIGGPAFAEMVR
jgi:2-polyprenyl-3-methyl-5-hydroxy-6-metoxy-1,4-benzoquinol methylase